MKKSFNTTICLIILLTFFTTKSACCSDINSNQLSTGSIKIGSPLIKITNLNDSGEGSLRQAIKNCNSCIIVFEVSGAINLKSDLNIEKNNIIIAGETSPYYGIILFNGTLHIRSSNITISNISIYPGSSPDPHVAENRDAISIYGSLSKQNTLNNIILSNISAGWGVDENIGIQGLADNIRIEHSLIAQPLRFGGHPKGNHSMNLLLGSPVKKVTIVGSVLAAAEQRNPRLTNGNIVAFINNFIIGTGAAATHLDTGKDIMNEGAIDIIGNYYSASSFTNCKRPAISLDEKFLNSLPKTQVYLNDNIIDNHAKTGCLKLPSSEIYNFNDSSLVQIDDWQIIPAAEVPSNILPTVGSHPLYRNPIDQKILEQIKDGSIAIVNNEQEIGGIPKIETKTVPLSIPDNIQKIHTEQDLMTIKNWLCTSYQKVTNLNACPYR